MESNALIISPRSIEGPLEPLPTFRVWLRYPVTRGRPEVLSMPRGATADDAADWYLCHGYGAADHIEPLPLTGSSTFAYPRTNA